MGDGEDISKNSVIRSEIGLSLHKTRELVTSWVGKSQDKLCFEGEKEGIDSEDDAVFSGRARKRLGLGANPQKRQDIELAKEKAQLRRKLSLFGRRRRENEDEKTEIYDDSDESESKSKYIEKISLLKQSKEHAGSDNEKRTTNSYFDIYFMGYLGHKGDRYWINECLN
ncbi:hypothetical protein MERGE_000512 [Pneumocystis wakefieldiae]|uniref:Uncharacterized protein n=1 Tax=Pneumocystis wakefieldiae TaxID=38082 RepID=A0A899GC25_9ASCO|nr:hypothetical protein MERGE_000512 [Pneumocystis wakefieldiae]